MNKQIANLADGSTITWTFELKDSNGNVKDCLVVADFTIVCGDETPLQCMAVGEVLANEVNLISTSGVVV